MTRLRQLRCGLARFRFHEPCASGQTPLTSQVGVHSIAFSIESPHHLLFVIRDFPSLQEENSYVTG